MLKKFKRIGYFLLIFTLIFTQLLVFTSDAKAEGNGVLQVNGSVSGNLSKDNFDDTYSITIPADGSLTLTTTADNTLSGIELFLLDTDGTTLMNKDTSGYTTNRKVVYDNIAPGTYVVKVDCYSNDYYGNYSINALFVKNETVNDSQENDFLEYAVNLTVNSSLTGHLGYYGSKKADTEDWYKISIPTDGALEIKTTADKTLTGLEIQLVDPTGKVLLSKDTSGYSLTRRISVPNVMPGVYVLKIDNYTATYYGGYQVDCVFDTQKVRNDAELNNDMNTALALQVGVNLTGHLGYSNGVTADLEDWYTVRPDASGKINIKTISQSTLTGLELNLFKYENNNLVKIAGDTSGYVTQRNINLNNVGSGTYYLKVDNYSREYYGGYGIAQNYEPILAEGDTVIEPIPEPTIAPTPEPTNAPEPTIAPTTDTTIDDNDDGTIDESEAKLETVLITPAAPIINVDQTIKLNAKATYTNGDAEDVANYAKWVSSNNKVVTVNSSGSIKGIAGGTATVTVTVEEQSFKIQVQVKDEVPKKILPVRAVIYTTVGAVSTNKINAIFSNNTKKDITKEVVLTSGNKCVTVNKNGSVKAVKKGTAVIKVTYKKLTVTYKVIVR